MNCIVSRNELLAALLFVSTEESRYILSGVLLESRPDHPPRIVATNGCVLCVIESLAEQTTAQTSGEIILAGDVLKAVCQLSKAMGGKIFPWVRFTNNPGSQQLDVELIGCGSVIDIEKNALLEGQYPNWKSVVPPKAQTDREPMLAMSIDPTLADKFCKAGKLLKDREVGLCLFFSGKERPIEVSLTAVNNFYGCLMPIKFDETESRQPDFVGL